MKNILIKKEYNNNSILFGVKRMSEDEQKKKPRLRGWIGRKAGAEEVSGSLDEKLTKALEDEEEK